MRREQNMRSARRARDGLRHAIFTPSPAVTPLILSRARRVTPSCYAHDVARLCEAKAPYAYMLRHCHDAGPLIRHCRLPMTAVAAVCEHGERGLPYEYGIFFERGRIAGGGYACVCVRETMAIPRVID